MIDEELDYIIPNRPLVWTWIVGAIAATLAGFWLYPIWMMLICLGLSLVWVNLYSTIMHYAFDAEEFTKLPIVGGAFVNFQSHHFPRWINSIHRKPMYDLLGELNPLIVINTVAPLALLQFRYGEVFAAWGMLTVVGGYAILCHRWAHMPPARKSAAVKLLQKHRLALSPEQHWKHHALAASPMGKFVPNFDLSFGWSNPLFNRMFKILPSPRFWLALLVVTTFTQVSALTLFLHWLRR
jgi:hypothetical protein